MAELKAKAKAEVKVKFKKLIKGAFGFNGETYEGSTIELTVEDAKHDRIVHAVKCGLLEKI